jgi:hypothetical protein
MAEEFLADMKKAVAAAKLAASLATGLAGQTTEVKRQDIFSRVGLELYRETNDSTPSEEIEGLYEDHRKKQREKMKQDLEVSERNINQAVISNILTSEDAEVNVAISNNTQEEGTVEGINIANEVNNNESTGFFGEGTYGNGSFGENNSSDGEGNSSDGEGNGGEGNGGEGNGGEGNGGEGNGGEGNGGEGNGGEGNGGEGNGG